MSPRVRTSRHENLARLALVVVGMSVILGVVGSIEGAIRVADPDLMIRRRGLQRYHRQLGWENRPNVRSETGGVAVSLDHKGRRKSGDRAQGDDERPHLLLLGDSVAFGLGVSDQESFAASLAQGPTPYRVTNAAVPGYGPDQSLLAYEAKLASEKPAAVIFALCLGNDLADVLARNHLYDERIPKPRFLHVGGALMLEETHVRRARLRGLMDRSFLLASLGPRRDRIDERPEQTERRLTALRAHSPDAEDMLIQILQRLRRRVESTGSPFLVAVFPDQRTLDPASTRWPRLQGKLAQHFDVADLVATLAQDETAYRRHTLDHIGHLTKQGHEQAARYLKGVLARGGSEGSNVD